MIPLRQRMLEELQCRNYSQATIENYISAVKEFAKYFRKSPEGLGAEEVRRYQLYLINMKQLAPQTVKVRMSALRFLYWKTLKRQDLHFDDMPLPKTPMKLAVVLSPEEVTRLIEAASSLMHGTILLILYATGIRRAELSELKVSDIDSQRMVIHIQKGKGRRDRDVPMTPKLLEALRQYWRWARSTVYLFPSSSSASSLLVGMGIALMFHLPADFQARKNIPPSQVRVASLSPRTLSMFFPGKLHKTARVLVAMVFAGDIAFYLLHVVSGHRFLAMLLYHTVAFGLSYGILVYYLRDRSIHRSSIARLSNKDVDTHYKQTSIGIIVGCMYLLIVLSAVSFVSWAYGYEFNPNIALMLSVMKAPDTMPSLLSNNGIQVWQAVAIVVSLPLLFWIPRSDAYRDLDKLSFTRGL